MPTNPAEVKRVAAEFVAEINAAYGLYLDATAGFAALVDMITRGQEQAGSTDDNAFFYGIGPPTDATNVLLHQTTLGALKKRIQDGGDNYFLLARLLIVLLYELWETGYRTPLATAAGVPRDQLLVPVFGDLRLLRHEVLHNKGRLTPETLSKLEVLTVPAAASIDLSKDDLVQVVRQVKVAVDEVVTKWTGEDPAYRTIWHLT